MKNLLIILLFLSSISQSQNVLKYYGAEVRYYGETVKTSGTEKSLDALTIYYNTSTHSGTPYADLISVNAASTVGSANTGLAFDYIGRKIFISDVNSSDGTTNKIKIYDYTLAILDSIDISAHIDWLQGLTYIPDDSTFVAWGTQQGRTGIYNLICFDWDGNSEGNWMQPTPAGWVPGMLEYDEDNDGVWLESYSGTTADSALLLQLYTWTEIKRIKIVTGEGIAIERNGLKRLWCGQNDDIYLRDTTGGTLSDYKNLSDTSIVDYDTTTLASNYTALQTTMSVTDASGFPTGNQNATISVDDFKYSKSGNTLTLVSPYVPNSYNTPEDVFSRGASGEIEGIISLPDGSIMYNSDQGRHGGLTGGNRIWHVDYLDTYNKRLYFPSQVAWDIGTWIKATQWQSPVINFDTYTNQQSGASFTVVTSNSGYTIEYRGSGSAPSTTEIRQYPLVIYDSWGTTTPGSWQSTPTSDKYMQIRITLSE